MSTPFNDSETCPGHDDSLTQLLYVACKISHLAKGVSRTVVALSQISEMQFLLQDCDGDEPISGEEGTAYLHIVAHACGFQVEALERDAVEVLRLVRSMKNSLAPINEVFQILVVDPVGLQEHRQNQHLHPTFTIFSVKILPQSVYGYQRCGQPADQEHSSTQILDHRRESTQRSSLSTQLYHIQPFCTIFTSPQGRR